jgi:hypothetical protein
VSKPHLPRIRDYRQLGIGGFHMTISGLHCWAISSPRSQVNERRSEAGSFRTCRLSAATTAAVSLPDTLTNAVKRE